VVGADRQEIREKGVELLETLMGIGPDGAAKKSDYDRIVVVAHSLGTIIAYDILTHCFARLNTRMTAVEDQPERAKLEGMIRAAAGLPGASGNAEPVLALDLDTFQNQQASCRVEINAQGSPWTVSDFVTLGSPLAHAEFLLAYDRADLRKAQERRVLPTCPPTLEHDDTTKLRHFSYRTARGAAAPRFPHHAALFAFTRWTNLYSPHKASCGATSSQVRSVRSSVSMSTAGRCPGSGTSLSCRSRPRVANQSRARARHSSAIRDTGRSQSAGSSARQSRTTSRRCGRR